MVVSVMRLAKEMLTSSTVASAPISTALILTVTPASATPWMASGTVLGAAVGPGGAGRVWGRVGACAVDSGTALAGATGTAAVDDTGDGAAVTGASGAPSLQAASKKAAARASAPPRGMGMRRLELRFIGGDPPGSMFLGAVAPACAGAGHCLWVQLSGSGYCWSARCPARAAARPGSRAASSHHWYCAPAR